METLADQDLFSRAGESAKSMAQAGDFPQTYWTLITNVSLGYVFIVVPQAGTLWVYYEWGNAPAADIGVWHEGGSTTPIQPGENQVGVGEGDMLYYQLSDPRTDEIKLGYQMI